MNTKPRQNAASDIAPPLPHSLEAERAVLGGLLLNGSALDAVIDTLKPDDFFLPQNVRIFSCMTELRKRHAPVDTVTVVDYLQRAGELEAAGGAAYVSALPDGLPHITHVEHYAQIVRDDAGRRLAIHRAEAIVQAAFDHEDIAEINRRFSETADLIRPAQECVPVIKRQSFLCAEAQVERLPDRRNHQRSLDERIVFVAWRGEDHVRARSRSRGLFGFEIPQVASAESHRRPVRRWRTE